MIADKEFERLFRQEFKGLADSTIFQNDLGEYEVFSKYRIVPEKPGYRVFCAANEVGVFSSTRSALSWCIADKHAAYNMALEILLTDVKLSSLTNDIAVRAAIGDRSKNSLFREDIGTKLESKIIHKKLLENRLAKCINWAKYYEQRGFNNEIARTSRPGTSKTSR